MLSVPGLDEVCSALRVTPRDFPRVAIADEFPHLVKARAVKVVAAVAALRELGPARFVAVCGGEEIEFDHLVACTGFASSFGRFLSQELRDAVHLQEEDLLQPVLLHEATWPASEVQNLAFVGAYRGPYFATLELQSRWIAGVFSGRLPPVRCSELKDGIEQERAIRRNRRLQFPHSDYVCFSDRIARRVGCLPPWRGDAAHPGDAPRPHKEDQSSDHAQQPWPDDSRLLTFMWKGPVIPANYRLVGEGASEDARDTIRRLMQLYPAACE